MSVIQRANQMEELYASNPDPWKNRERGLYNILMKEVVDKVLSHLPDVNPVKWCDIGCGGGNVFDGLLLNANEHGVPLELSGVDMSQSALDWLRSQEKYGNNFQQMDLEEYEYVEETPPVWSSADVVSWIEVLYYFGDKRPWRDSFNEFWRGVKPGTIVIVADSLVPYAYRDYLKNEVGDAELIETYTDYSEAVSVEKRSDGKTWTRWFKVRIYRKLGK